MSAPRPTWRALWYSASVDAATTARQSDAITTIAALAGYATLTTYIVKPEPDWDAVFNAKEDVSGAVTSRGVRKRTFKIEMHPYLYLASSNPDLDDKDALIAFLTNVSFLWVRIEAGNNYPATPAYAHPVEILSWAYSSSGGYHKVTVECRVRYYA